MQSIVFRSCRSRVAVVGKTGRRGALLLSRRAKMTYGENYGQRYYQRKYHGFSPRPHRIRSSSNLCSRPLSAQFSRFSTTSAETAAETASLRRRVIDWLMRRQLPSRWMYIWIWTAQSFKTFGLIFAIWKFEVERELKEEADVLSKFFDDVEDVHDFAMKNNPAVLLNTISVHLNMLRESEIHEKNIAWMTRFLDPDVRNVFLERSSCSKSAESLRIFDRIDVDKSGVITMNDVMWYGNRMSKGAFINEMAILLGCNESWVGLAMYSLDNLKRRKKHGKGLDEKARDALVVGDLWKELLEKGDETALVIDDARRALLCLFRMIQNCYESNPRHRSHPLMESLLDKEPLSMGVARRYVGIVEPLMMAIFRSDGQSGENYETARDNTFPWFEKIFDIKRSHDADAYSPKLEIVEKVIRTPHVGDRVIVTKNGSQYGNEGVVVDPHWFGRTKILMDSGVEKSYLFSKGELRILVEADDEEGG